MPATKFTAGRRKTILAALERGHYLKHAAALAGVGESTLREWLDRGRDAKATAAYREFAEAVAASDAKAVDVHLSVIQQADDPRVSLEFLSRRHPGLYGRSERTEVTGADGGPLVVRLEWAPGPIPAES